MQKTIKAKEAFDEAIQAIYAELENLQDAYCLANMDDEQKTQFEDCSKSSIFNQTISKIFHKSGGSDNLSAADRLRVLHKSADSIPGKWRAEHGGRYYAVNNCGVTSLFRDDYYGFDDECYRSGNYFRTLDEAELYAEQWRKLFGTDD